METRNVSLTTDIIEEIERRKEHGNFNFSKWVRDRFRDEFLSIETKEEQIAEKKRELNELLREKERLQEQRVRSVVDLDEECVEEMRMVPAKIQYPNKYDRDGIYQYFVNEFGLDVGQDHFYELVDVVVDKRGKKKLPKEQVRGDLV